MLVHSGRIEGIIRWSSNHPDAAVVSHGSGDYHADFMDLQCLRRPSDGERVSFLPQQLHGVLQARAIDLAHSPLRNPPVPGRTPTATPVATPVSPALVRCQHCSALVAPRTKAVGGRGHFKRVCPKCDASLGRSPGRSPVVGFVSAVAIGVTVLVSLLVW